MNAHETQEGVMDSLMEALQTGSAFSRPDQRRKRPTRVAGGKFYKAAYVWRRMTKKERAIQRYIFSNNVCKSTELKHGCENVTPNGIQRDVRWNEVTGLCEADNSTSYCTPEENQELYKQILIDEVKKAPRQTKCASKVTHFQRKKRCDSSSWNHACFTILPMNDETPKRNVLVKALGNLESRCVAIDIDSNPFTDENALLLNEARMISPIKKRRVVISKMRNRNSMVRRAILNRKRIRAYDTSAKRRIFQPLLQSTLYMNTTMPPAMNQPVLNTYPESLRMSVSTDNLCNKVLERASSPIMLLRSKNYENLAQCKDENQNDRDTKSMYLDSSLSYEMSGIALLSENSLLHVVNPNHLTRTITKDIDASSRETSEKFARTYESSVLEISNSTVKSNNSKTKMSKRKSWKKNWKFWAKTSTNGI